ncbi:MAG: hypothetical protein WDN50_06400 [Bradyrhizobium sp.]
MRVPNRSPAARPGLGKSPIAYDQRAVQGANSELPAGGLLWLGGLADIVVSHDPATVSNSFSYGQPVIIAARWLLHAHRPRDPNSIPPSSSLATIQVSDTLSANAVSVSFP